jgi:hypothetical protein
VIVLGMLVAIAGIIFAVASYEYCVELREQTALQDRDLTERVRASEQGRTLQPSTLPAPNPPPSLPDPRPWVVGGLALLAGAAGVAWLVKRN